MITVIYLWRIERRNVARAIGHMATDRFTLKRNQAIKFFKLIGTGTGETFTPRDADPTLWGLIITIEQSALFDFDTSALLTSWRKIAVAEERRIATPLSAHGQPTSTTSYLSTEGSRRTSLLGIGPSLPPSGISDYGEEHRERGDPKRSGFKHEFLKL